MAEISLRPGQVLHIASAGRVLRVRHAGSAWEVRVLRPGLAVRIAAWWRARHDQVALEELDPRTLRDIGLDALGARVAERRRLQAHWARFPWF
jgi:hypothetical protein